MLLCAQMCDAVEGVARGVASTQPQPSGGTALHAHGTFRAMDAETQARAIDKRAVSPASIVLILIVASPLA